MPSLSSLQSKRGFGLFSICSFPSLTSASLTCHIFFVSFLYRSHYCILYFAMMSGFAHKCHLFICSYSPQSVLEYGLIACFFSPSFTSVLVLPQQKKEGKKQSICSMFHNNALKKEAVNKMKIKERNSAEFSYQFTLWLPEKLDYLERCLKEKNVMASVVIIYVYYVNPSKARNRKCQNCISTY